MMDNAPRSSMTAVPPNRLSATERLDEAASILAAGCLRLIAREKARGSVNISPDERSFASTYPPARASMASKLKEEKGHE